MTEMTYTVGWREVSASMLKAMTVAKPKPKGEAPDEYHRGWSVEGYPPGQISAAKKAADDAVDAWFSMSQDARDTSIKEGLREPKRFDLDLYLASIKPKKVRSKPYEIPSSAEQCAELAKSYGWEHVRVVEVKKQKVA